jgi:hypothetical protein
MESRDAFRKGFRVAWSERRIVAVEIAWRWGFWAAVSVLALATLALWLDSVPLSSADIRNLRAGPPWLVAATLLSILSTASSSTTKTFLDITKPSERLGRNRWNRSHRVAPHYLLR